MTVIKQSDFIQSIADAFQFISFYHPADFIKAMAEAYEHEQSPAAKNAIAQILINSRMSAEGHRPICQDTGIAVVFVKAGMNVSWDATMSVQEMVDEGVRRAYTDKDNPLRASVLSDPDGHRKNTRDNTPAVVHMEIVPGDRIEVKLAAKGGGSESKSRFAVLNPSDDVVEWILGQIPTMGGDWCPPGMLGVGIGGTPEKAMVMAKESLMAPINLHELRKRGPKNRAEALRLELHEKVNALGMGAQGLGGLTTVLDVKVLDYATHAVMKPVAIVPNCAATRHIEFHLDGSGAARFEAPSLENWPKLALDLSSGAKRVNLETLTKSETATWKAGDRLLLTGKIVTGRDAAHKRLTDLIAKGEKLPVDLTNRLIYYVGPVDAVRDEAVGPAGPTTSRRMDKFMDAMLGQTGLLGSIGKSERGAQAIDAIKRHQGVHLIAVGGAAYLVSKAIRAARVLAFQDLGMEAIHEFDVKDMPVTVAVDTGGNAVHESGPREWRARIGKIPVTVRA
ncbi:MAG: fumarate hydratase [Betaproteobacteria bacterium SG8_41]|jgi:fumarate hydratase class I|nr:MAG: fumarate hydratase [Betaproteobacteria bacterium SG8_41]